MALNVELDMTVEELNEVSISIDDEDELEFGMNQAIVIRNHDILINRDVANQHPISAITGLEEALASIPDLNDIIWDCGTASEVV